MNEEKLHDLIKADEFMIAVANSPDWVFETAIGIMILWRKMHKGLRNGLSGYLTGLIGEANSN